DFDGRGKALRSRWIEDRVARAPQDHDRNPAFLDEIAERSRLPARGEVLVGDRPQRFPRALDSLEAKHAFDHLGRDEVRVAEQKLKRRLDILALLGGDEALDEVGVDLLAESGWRDSSDRGDPLGMVAQDLERDRSAQRMAGEGVGLLEKWVGMHPA